MGRRRIACLHGCRMATVPGEVEAKDRLAQVSSIQDEGGMSSKAVRGRRAQMRPPMTDANRRPTGFDGHHEEVVQM